MIFYFKSMATILFVTSVLFLFSGCFGKIPLPFKKTIVKQPPIPEQIHKQPTNNSYKNARVLIFRFNNPSNYPLVGYTAADILYKKLVSKNIFKEVESKLKSEGMSIEDQLAFAANAAFDLIITGRVLHYLDGTSYQKSRVDEEIMVYAVVSKEMLWHAEATAQGTPVPNKDYYLYEKAGALPPSPSKLLIKNSEKFINMLQ